LLQAALVGVHDLAVVDVEFLGLLRAVPADVLLEPLPDAGQVVGSGVGVAELEGAAPDDQRPQQRPVPGLVNPRQNHVTSLPTTSCDSPVEGGDYTGRSLGSTAGADAAPE